MTKTSPASAAIQQRDHNSSNACSKKQCIVPLPSAQHTPAHIFHKNNTRLLMLLLMLDTAIVVGAPASST
jgi:hypothetical protein